jgi:hypothetical protein
MKTYRISVPGAMLERGFWLYVCRIIAKGEEYIYVGRTGDSSSKFADSPFSRLGRHLDVKKSAYANMLLRHVDRLSLDRLNCSYEMFAIGPLFPEQTNIKKHRELRDVIAPLESALASYLRQKGFTVVNDIKAIGEVDKVLFSKIKNEVDRVLFNKTLLYDRPE